jgi:hypothetical protein
MTFKQLAKQLDVIAMNLVKDGKLDKAFGALEVAAHIRRFDPKILRKQIPTTKE